MKTTCVETEVEGCDDQVIDSSQLPQAWQNIENFIVTRQSHLAGGIDGQAFDSVRRKEYDDLRLPLLDILFSPSRTIHMKIRFNLRVIFAIVVVAAICALWVARIRTNAFEESLAVTSLQEHQIVVIDSERIVGVNEFILVNENYPFECPVYVEIPIVTSGLPPQKSFLGKLIGAPAVNEATTVIISQPTDLSVEEIEQTLEEINSLKTVYLDALEISESDVARMRKIMPNVEFKNK